MSAASRARALSMRLSTLALCGLTLLGGCASPLPPHDPQQAWVDLRATAGEQLMADRLDGQRVGDGRYFQLAPGAHDLKVRFQFEVQRSGNLMSEPLRMTCEIRVRYDDFAAGRRYRLEARPLSTKAQAWLYDEQRNTLARGQTLRCGTYF